jgi:hypothetical protein
VLQTELVAAPPAERLSHIFHTISYLLRPFSMDVSDGSTEVQWSSVDDKLLTILLGCVTSASDSSAPHVQRLALDALLNCLPHPHAHPALATTAGAGAGAQPPGAPNHIVVSLVTADEDSGEQKTNLQKLLEFATSARYMYVSLSVALSLCLYVSVSVSLCLFY